MVNRLFVILEMIKFGHSVFALPFVLLAAFLAAKGFPGWGKAWLVVVCMVLGRNVGMTYNRLADADLDAANPRTRGRAIPAGLVSRGWAGGFIIVNAVGFVLVCSLFWFWYGNLWPVVFSGPVLAYLCVYSHLKRKTVLCHFALGGAHVIAVLAGFVAVDPGALTWGGVVLALAVGCWTVGFDIIYATLDVAFDRSAGVYSLPAKLGLGGGLFVSRMLHLASVAGFGLAGWGLGLGWIFGLGVVMTAILLAVEHSLVRPADLTRVNVAFFTMNGVVSVVLSMFGFLDVWLKRK